MTYDIQLTELQAQPAAVVHGHVVDENGIGDFLGRAFGEVMGVMEQQGVHPAGAPFGRYRPTPDGGFDVEAGFPVSGPVTGVGDVEPLLLPGGRCVRTLHVGDWGKLEGAYAALKDWAVDNGCTPREDPWESYLDGPDVPEPRTEVYMPYDVARPRP